jgi:hypothetical protein
MMTMGEITRGSQVAATVAARPAVGNSDDAGDSIVGVHEMTSL